MRVIAGIARSTPLAAPKGLETRPTTDRIKETLFNMLQFQIRGRAFFDLFAGSGAMGIEAVSRGASRAVLIDQSREAGECIRKNIAKCHFEDRTEFYMTDVCAGLARLCGRPELKSPVVFLDPPYGKDLEFPVLRKLSELGLVDGGSLVILETDLSWSLPEGEAPSYELVKEKCYKNQKHVFLKLRETGGDYA